MFVFVCSIVPYNELMLINNNDILTEEEYNNLISKTGLVRAKSVFAGTDDELNEYVVKFKLFNYKFNIVNKYKNSKELRK